MKLHIFPRITSILPPRIFWLHGYRLKRLVRNSFWFWPLMVILSTVFVALPMVRWFDAHGYQIAFLWKGLTVDQAQVVVASFSASMLTFLVFVLSSLLTVVTLASAQLTPRIMAFTFADRQAKVLTCMLLFSFLFGTAVLGQIGSDHVPLAGVKITIISVLATIILFLRFIPHLGMSLRPISLMRKVAEQGHNAIEDIYPRQYGTAASEKAERIPRALMRKDAITVAYTGPSGVLMAFSAAGLVAAAEAAGCTIELEQQVGNFVSRGDPLFKTFPPGRPVDARVLHHLVAIGEERTLEQDPVFAFRVIVDIANRALSPAVNDPTTAVLAVDQLERLLRDLGTRQLDPGMLYDGKDNLRLIYPVPDWEDYVSLAVSEIRLYGANSIQVPRRLLACLEHLIGVLPTPRAPALREELRLLAKAVAREFLDTEDRERMSTGDRQGLGGIDADE